MNVRANKDAVEFPKRKPILDRVQENIQKMSLGSIASIGDDGKDTNPLNENKGSSIKTSSNIQKMSLGSIASIGDDGKDTNPLNENKGSSIKTSSSVQKMSLGSIASIGDGGKDTNPLDENKGSSIKTSSSVQASSSGAKSTDNKKSRSSENLKLSHRNDAVRSISIHVHALSVLLLAQSIIWVLATAIGYDNEAGLLAGMAAFYFADLSIILLQIDFLRDYLILKTLIAASYGCQRNSSGKK
eukprot:CAMPEP_0114506172 /NCGR_PEP_ID=MMETSP0109-20121206/11275_1 /TAXON_ID=29199 /ORGANISM="Chlorarachnion reptans, Strain CCCM449" /LENGTH=242 /DNA_ID=CAMNT_0001684721 /DNA_START=417 /DNA_END=1145 /DNA_ORIENTATION=-